MRIGIFVRTAITLFFNVSACFGATSHSRRDNRTDTSKTLEAAALIDIIPTRAKAIDGVHEKDKNDEARGVNPVAVHVIDPNVEKGEMIAKFSSDLKNIFKLGTQTSTENIAKVMEHEHWALMMKETDDWLLKQHVEPKTVFSYMNLESIVNRDMDIVKMSDDPKLLLWFRYIIEYRRMDSTSSNHAAFDDKELLGFLVKQMEARSLELTLSLDDKSLPGPHIQVVTLFETYRHDPSMKSFAEDMLTYMVTDSVTKDHVLNVWLQKEELPFTIFRVLHLNDEHGRVDLDDKTVFTAWLDYVKMYLQSGAPNFRAGDIIFLQLSMMSVPRARAMFESNALEHVLGGVEHKTGNLAAYLRDLWQRFPLHIFNSLKLLGTKITDDNYPTFRQAIAFIAAYMNTMPFDGAIVYRMLKPVHSFDEIEGMFKTFKYQTERFADLSVRQRKDVKIFAGKMLQYLPRYSQPELALSNLHPDDAWNKLLEQGVDTEILLKWVKYSVLYYSREENKSVENAMPTVLKSLHEKIVKKEISPNLWLTVLEELRKEHGPLWNLLKQILSQGRKRKAGPT